MSHPTFKRLPRHVAVIPDGNRRWARERGLSKAEGYAHGIKPGLDLFALCAELGIEEVTAYGFTNDNTRRPSDQRMAFQRACVEGVRCFTRLDIEILVVGNTESPMFPPELRPYTTRQVCGKGGIHGNFLVNYDWHWDLTQALREDRLPAGRSRESYLGAIGSADVSRIDLVVRWGGRRRLSGLLPVQSVYADFYVIDDYWPDFHPDQFFEALHWYETQDITLGG